MDRVPLLTDSAECDADDEADSDSDDEVPILEATLKGLSAGTAAAGRSDDGDELPLSGRSILAFWMLGLCNNYGYVVMLSAAADIIAAVSPGESSSDSSSSNDTNPDRQCNEISTGAILLADIIPSLVIKMLAPFFPLWIHLRMGSIVLFNVAGFILVSQAKDLFMALTGVVSMSLASGLGEASILAHMALYKNKSSISAWSSGTGGAGFFGSLSYMLLVYVSGNDRSQPLLIFLLVPVMMAISFWVILESPQYSQLDVSQGRVSDIAQSNSTVNEGYGRSDEESTRLTATHTTLIDKLKMMPEILKYMLPFGLVYLFEYFINQGLYELIHFDLSWLPVPNQYVAYQLCYQIGVFASRSSINLFTINNTWLMAIFQGVNVVIFSTEAIYSYIPNFFIVVALVLWEGLLGGLSYVNTYNRLNKEIPEEKREFAMSINSFGDALGISLAGFIAIPVHNAICSMPLYARH
ncbi:CLN3 protein [Nesidiocoris tenuis]|uniref:Battenin n=1 Tax=Nesidiocoris tenuis TaxID=355587 RepID=A0ABN7AF63_9HEMI|nr:CLN3 protein [Nesidiocoris tenuis]